MFSYLTERLHDLIDTRNECYRLVAMLEGHSGPINAFSFNLNGTLLASGGDDEEVQIWDLHTFRKYQTLADHSRWGQITCLRFLNVEQGSTGEWLCFGTGRGYLLLYHRQRKTADFVEVSCLELFNRGDSVEAFAFDPHFGRVAVSSHYGEIRMLRLQGTSLMELWKSRLDVAAIPRALGFVDRGEAVNIFTMENGIMYCRDAETSTVKHTRNLRSSIGSVNMCAMTGNLLIDNMTDGFDLYTANRLAPIRSFPVKATKKYVKSGVFAEGGRAIACGSDHGRVYVFGITDKKPKQELLHGNRKGMIQTVAAHSTSNIHSIASGASDGNFDIYIWKRLTKQSLKQGKNHTSAMTMLIFINMLFLCIFAWATTDMWSPVIKTAYDSISTRVKTGTDLYIKFFDSKVNTERSQSPSLTEMSQGRGLAEMLHDLDDETLRKIFKMPPPLTVHDLLRDKGDPLSVEAFQQPDGKRRHDEREPAFGRRMKKEEPRRNERDPGVDIPLVNNRRRDKRKPASKVTVDDHQCKEQQGLN